MIDPTYEIRKYYIDLLSSISVPVVNMATLSLEPPFVVVSTRAQESGTKTSFDHMVTTTFEIVVKTDGDWGGDKLAEDIAAEIMPDILGDRPVYGSTANFKIITSTMEASAPEPSVTDTGRTIKKVITIDNYVSQILTT